MCDYHILDHDRLIFQAVRPLVGSLLMPAWSTSERMIPLTNSIQHFKGDLWVIVTAENVSIVMAFMHGRGIFARRKKQLRQQPR